MKRIAVGDTAPNFTLKDNRAQDVSLADLRGKKVLLSWHPLAWTKVCAEQMKSLEANLAEFEKYNTIPLGMSIDTYPSKNAWAKELGVANVQLLADFWPHGYSLSLLLLLAANARAMRAQRTLYSDEPDARL